MASKIHISFRLQQYRQLQFPVHWNKTFLMHTYKHDLKFYIWNTYLFIYIFSQINHDTSSRAQSVDSLGTIVKNNHFKIIWYLNTGIYFHGRAPPIGDNQTHIHLILCLLCRISIGYWAHTVGRYETWPNNFEFHLYLFSWWRNDMDTLFAFQMGKYI